MFLGDLEQKKWPILRTEVCCSLCVMFAFGRRFEDKQGFVMMLSVLLRHMLLQVQAGDNNTLSKHTQGMMKNKYYHGMKKNFHLKS